MATGIQWTDETINPIVGCSKISAGCQNCYAETMASRQAAMGKQQYKEVVSVRCGTGLVWNGKTCFVPSALDKPFAWKAPRSIFICSMSDLFHEATPYGWVDQVLAMVALNSQHTFIVLTKRPERMQQYFKSVRGVGYKPLANLVLGVSVENQQTADERIPVLLQIPAAKKFISLEPMIGAVNLEGYDCDGHYCGRVPLDIDCVILGGESGNKARMLDPAWVRIVRDQCQSAGTAFFFKQWSKAGTEGRPWEYLAENGFPALDGRTHTELAWSLRK